MGLAVGAGRILRVLLCEGQTTQGRGVLSAKAATVSRNPRKQAWRFPPAPRGFVHLSSSYGVAVGCGTSNSKVIFRATTYHPNPATFIRLS